MRILAANGPSSGSMPKLFGIGAAAGHGMSGARTLRGSFLCAQAHPGLTHLYLMREVRHLKDLRVLNFRIVGRATFFVLFGR